MGLSVIVTAYRSTETLRECVERLCADPDVSQILVADCTETAPDVPVTVRRFPTPTAVPVMRWAMLPEVTRPVVACLEGRCVPEAGWAAKILAAHAAHPDAAAIGGAVDIAPDAGWLDRVVWFCEYAAFAPPLADIVVPDISGAHLSYKTEALRAERNLLDTGAWETRLHLRWRGRVRTAPVSLLFRNGMGFGGFTRQRLQYGRGYAAARGAGWLHGFLTPLLPLVLTLRTAKAARAGWFLACLPGILFFHSVWSCGELLGYWFGASPEQHIY